MKKNSLLNVFLFFLFVLLSLICICVVIYIRRNFALIGSNPISQILFHCIVQIDGADPTFIRGIIIRCVLLPLIGAFIATYFVFTKNRFLCRIKKLKVFDFMIKHALLISLICAIGSFAYLANELKLVDYIKTVSKTSTLYEDDYVDPGKVEYTFPEKKRNLIYIILESAEISDYSREEGGFFDRCLIPELYQLAQDNITFNDNKGFNVAPNTSWTVASMVAQGSGIPLTIPIGENDFVTSNKYLPGAYSIGQILEQGGYTNELLIGSEAVFSGRKYYYEMHGNYLIHDFNYFVENDLFDYDTRVWWGIVDRYLFEYAKQDLIELSKNNEPFNLTMLTVDTHHNDGWVCEDCKDEFEYQLENVYACSSRKVQDFIDWCKQQDFYENTTIVLAGDHNSMSPTFNELIVGYHRNVYYAFINPYPGLVPTQNRELCAFDLFPTTVSSLGIEYDGNRLGLGSNLFSDEKTLIEKYGRETFFNKVKERSAYYENHILYGFD